MSFRSIERRTDDDNSRRDSKDTLDSAGQSSIVESLAYYEPTAPDFFSLSQLSAKEVEGQQVIQATIFKVRKQGAYSFLELMGSDPNDILQVVIPTPAGEVREAFKSLELRRGSVVRVGGEMKTRPAEAIRESEAQNRFSRFEFQTQVNSIFVMEWPRKVDSALKWRDVIKGGLLTPDLYGEILRMPEFRRIQKFRQSLADTFLTYFKSNDFIQVNPPALTKSTAESGAEVFRVHGRDHAQSQSEGEMSAVRELSLNQSPQQFKQIMAAVYERVVCQGQFFRDDPSFTAHHLAEFTGLDMEMVVQHDDKLVAMGSVMDELSQVVRSMVEVMKTHPQVFIDNNAEIPQLPAGSFPIISYEDALAFAREKEPHLPDFNRTGEGIVAEMVKATTGSDFYFVVGFPADDKPFYTDIVGDGTSFSFDLIFRGVEIASGGLRISDPVLLRQRLHEKGFTDFDKYQEYLDNFERGTAQTGGFGVGLDRLVANSLGGLNVKLTTPFPKSAQIALG